VSVYRASVREVPRRSGALHSSALFAWKAVSSCPSDFLVATWSAQPCEPCFVEADEGSELML